MSVTCNFCTFVAGNNIIPGVSGTTMYYLLWYVLFDIVDTIEVFIILLVFLLFKTH